MNKIDLIKALLSDDNSKGEAKANSCCDLDIKIAILQRGWVVIGRYSEKGEYCFLNDAYVIRRWGTNEGLGQLALEGKQEETKLEKTGIVKFHKLTSVFFIDCDFKKWDNELK